MGKRTDKPVTRTVAGICRYCSGGCGAIFTVRGGEITAMAGDPGHPQNQGSLCAKASTGGAGRRTDRVTRPLWRPAGADGWRELSWRQAINMLAARLKAAREAGWQADGHTEGIAVFASACVTNEEAYLLAKLARLLGTNYIEHQGRV